MLELLLLALLADVPLLGRLDPAPVTVERGAFVMGTRLQVTVMGESRSSAIAASEAALGALERTERRLSTWDDESELSRLNRNPKDIPFTSSPELWSELEDAVACSVVTHGGFDPSVGLLVQAWGLRVGGRRPSAYELSRAADAVGLDALEMPAPRTLIRRRDDLVLEEGAFGKGSGLDHALEAIAATPGTRAAVLDLGGQVAVWRRRESDDGEPIVIAVADPVDRDRALLAIGIDRGSLSTTGNSERAVVVDGQRYSHVLDPRTGQPAADLGSVTVWAPRALDADCLSTGLFVLGLDEIARFALSHPEVGVLVVEADHESDMRIAWASAGLAKRVTVLAANVEVRHWSKIGDGARRDDSRTGVDGDVQGVKPSRP